MAKLTVKPPIPNFNYTSDDIHHLISSAQFRISHPIPDRETPSAGGAVPQDNAGRVVLWTVAPKLSWYVICGLMPGSV